MKKVINYILFFIILCLLCNYGIDYTVSKQIEKKSPYYLAFASIGVNSLECRLDSWAKIKTISNEKELEFYLIEILKSLNIPFDSKKCIKEYNDESNILHFTTELEEIEYMFILESDRLKNETYFIINIMSKDESIFDLIPVKLDQILGITWTHYYKYHGILGVSVRPHSVKELMQVLEKNLKITEPEKFTSNKTHTSTGYSSVLSKRAPSMEIKGQKVNVQMAIQVDEDLHQTNIYIGSPLILGDY